MLEHFRIAVISREQRTVVLLVKSEPLACAIRLKDELSSIIE